MNTTNTIGLVRARLEKHRRLNTALLFLTPVLLVCAAILTLRYHLLGPVVAWLCLILVLSGFGYLLRKFKPWKGKVRLEDAAQLLDRQLKGKDRFLTLASLKAADDTAQSLNIIDKEATYLASNFSIYDSLPFRLTPEAKYSAFASPVAIGLLISLLWIHDARKAPPEFTKRAEEISQELRDLASTNTTLPKDIKDNLKSLADSLEEEGLLSEDAQEILSNTLEDIAELEKAPEDQKNIEAPKDFSKESTPPELEPRKDQPIPETQKEEHQSPDQSNKQQSANDSSEKPSQEKSGNDSNESKDGKSEGDKKSESGEQSQDKNQGQEDSDKKDAQDSQAGMPGGTQGEQEGRQTGSDKPKDDPKKDETGVGEGHGKGKSGSEKDPQGENQTGKDDAGAKDGDAQNPNAGKSSGSQSKKGDKNQTPNGSNGESKDGSKKGGPSGKQQGELSQVKESLEQIKEEIDHKKSGGNEEGKEQDNNSKGDKQGKDEKSPGGGKKSSQNPKDQNKNSTNQGTGENKNQDATKPSDGKDDNKSASNSENNSSEKRPAEQNDSNKPGGSQSKSPNASDKPATGSRYGDHDSQDSHPEKTTDSQKSQQPNDKSLQPGRLEGGKDGEPLIGKNTERVQVEMPDDEKIVVRGLGAEEKKLYRNPNEAQAKTALGSQEFEKPQADLTNSSQPIPVEYKDLLR